MAMKLEEALKGLDQARMSLDSAQIKFEEYMSIRNDSKQRSLILSSPWEGGVNESDEWIRVEPGSPLYPKLYEAGLVAMGSMMSHAFAVMDEAVKNYQEARDAAADRTTDLLRQLELQGQETQ